MAKGSSVHGKTRNTTAALLVALLMGVWGYMLAGRPHSGEAHSEGEDDGAHHQGERACRGFVVLSDGFAVLSGLPTSPAHGSAGDQQSAAQAGQPVADKDHTPDAPPHLLGYTHGQEILPQEGMLCVPIVSAGTLKWTAIGDKTAPTVTLEAPKGTLIHGNRTNATFALTIRRGDAPVEPAQVRLLVRMPHHDWQMPGGHGPANDPDVQGIAARPVGPGRYTIPSINFSMGGPWLLEVHVQQGSETHKAYLAADVGEKVRPHTAGK